MSRFDYVKYDDRSQKIQDLFKEQVVSIESDIKEFLSSPVEKHNALMKLEEFYMWIGKAIKKDQLNRTGEFELQEERKNG